MQNGTDIEKDYDASLPTFKFILLTIATFGFYYWYWVLNFVKMFNKKSTITIVSPIIILVVISLMEWSTGIDPSDIIGQYEENLEIFSIISTLLYIAAMIIHIYAVVSIRKHLETDLKKLGYIVKVNIVFSVVFLFYYFYYIIHNHKIISSKNKLILSKSETPPTSVSGFE